MANAREILEKPLKCTETDFRNESNDFHYCKWSNMLIKISRNMCFEFVSIFSTIRWKRKLCVPICFIQSDLDFSYENKQSSKFFSSIPTVHLVPFNISSKLFPVQMAVSKKKIVRRVTGNTLYTRESRDCAVKSC